MAATRRTIGKILDDRLSDHMFIVVSQAEPYIHNYVKDVVKTTRGTGGLVAAMEPLLKANKGLWIAHGRGAADREVVDEHDKIKMPPGKKAYILKRIWVNKKNYRGWYYGFSNEALWPLCHNVFERPTFRQSDWEAYVEVNQQFADAILAETEGKKAVVWIQDYHLALVPQMLKDKRPDLMVGYFWHIPWPLADTFRICPWSKEVLEGMLGNELIGFQRHTYCRNFLTSVSKELEAKVDFDAMTVTYNNKTSYIRHFPISIDYQAVRQSSEKNKKFGKSYIKQTVTGRYEYLSVGVDRIEYTKGLPERIKAIDRFLEKYPEYQEKFVHINILVPSRTLIKRYEDLDRELETLIENVNFKYATANWQPIHTIKESLPPSEVYKYYKSANVAMVTSLADGMNLVAKEYVAAGPDDGVLILSEQTGAADELHDALIVNPYDIERLADSIKLALEMPRDERKRRMEALRTVVAENNVYTWASRFIHNIFDINSHLELRTENGNPATSG
jgi:alpha,alpha-trehalose-phosphate synthase [UDP-forming]